MLFESNGKARIWLSADGLTSTPVGHFICIPLRLNAFFKALHNSGKSFFGELLGGFLGMVIPSPDAQRPQSTIFWVGDFSGATVPISWKIQSRSA